MELTKREVDALAYIRSFIEEWGYSPTVREVGLGLGLTSTQFAHTLLSGLREKGAIDWDEGKKATALPRTIRVLTSPEE